MRDVRLAARLVAGGGRAQLARLILMSVGLAFGILALLLVVQVPNVLHSRDEVLRLREPVPTTDGQGAGLSVLANHGSWHGAPLLRVFLAASEQPAGAPAQPPPGVTTLPGPGEVVLSPEAARLRASTEFGPLVAGQEIGTVGPAGLTGPDELVAYIGVPVDGSLGSPTVRFGAPVGVSVAGTGQFEFVTAEAAVLVLPTAIIYVLACGRLAAATRRRRYAALRLVGASRRTLSTVATLEAGAASLLGTVIGVLLYRGLNGPLGSSGLMGLTWFADQARIGTSALVALVVAALLGARVAGGLSGHRAMIDPLQERRSVVDRSPRWWLAVPLLAGLGLLIPLLPFGSTGARGPVVQVVLVLGAALSAIGVLLAGRLLTEAIARPLARGSAPLGIRLGAARLLTENARAAGLVSGLALLLLVSATGAGLTHAAEQQASSAARPVSVHVYANELPASDRSAMVGLGAAGQSWATILSQVTEDDSEPVDDVQWKIEHLGVRMLVADCAQVDRLLELASSCQPDHLYRLVSERSRLPLTAGQPVQFDTATGVQTVATPADTLQSREPDSALASQTSLVYTAAQDPDGWPDSATFFYVIAPGIDSLDRFSSALAEVAPSATANSSLDLSALAAFRQHQAAIRLGVGVGYSLALLALLISLVDRNVERRRDVVALVVVGTPTRTVRLGQLVFACVPALALGLLAIAVGLVVANAFGSFDSTRPRWYLEPLTASLPLAALGLAVTAASSLLVVGLDPRAADLRRE